MRKIWTAILMLFCITCLSGCMRFNTTVKVKSNGKVDVTMLYAVSNQLSEDETYGFSGISEQEVEKMKEDGWECIEYAQDDYTGYQFVKKNINIEELDDSMTEPMEGEGEADEVIDPEDIKVHRKGLTYIIDWKILEEDQLSELSIYKPYFEMLDGSMTFTIELPSRPKNSNATYVSEDGRTLTWNLLELESGVMHIEFRLFNWAILLTAMSVIMSIVIIVIAIIVVVSANNKKKVYLRMQNSGQNSGAPMSSQMGTPQNMQNNVSQSAMQNMQNNVSQSAVQNIPLQGPSVADEILKLKKLMDEGIITSEEFEAQKKKLLG